MSFSKSLENTEHFCLLIFQKRKIEKILFVCKIITKIIYVILVLDCDVSANLSNEILELTNLLTYELENMNSGLKFVLLTLYKIEYSLTCKF